MSRMHPTTSSWMGWRENLDGAVESCGMARIRSKESDIACNRT
jgi:hypothetical protein